MKSILDTRPDMRRNPRPGKKQQDSSGKRVGFYLRVSTEEQAENPEGSIKNQEERLKMALTLKNGSGPFGTLVDVFCDAGRSGKNMNRPELQRLLKAIAGGQINMVMVSELSRQCRESSVPVSDDINVLKGQSRFWTSKVIVHPC